MRTNLFFFLILTVLPAVATEPKPSPKPEPPPTPPPAIYEVWGYKWDGSQYVKQSDHCLKTTDLKQAADYSQEILSYAGWLPSVNLPDNCYQHHVYYDPTVPTWAACTVDGPDRPVYEVWAFKLVDGKWVKSDEYSWSSRSREGWDIRYVALDLAKRINAVPGWCATTNAPDCQPPYPLRVHAGTVRGLPYGYQSYGASGTSRGGYPVYSEHGGRTVYRPHMTIRLGADADWHYRHTPHNDP